MKTKLAGKISPKKSVAPRLKIRSSAAILGARHGQLVQLVQPALRVGAVNDPAEREAEVMASRVVASSAPVLDTPDAAKNSGINDEPNLLHRNIEDQPNLESLNSVELPSAQADVTVPEKEDVKTTDLETQDTTELASGEPEDTSGEEPAPDSAPIADAPPPILGMRRSEETAAMVGRSGGMAPQEVSNLVASPGPGRALPVGLRKRIEPHFGVSFADVRLHDSPADQQAAARIGARAFTHKNRIWLAEGESETNTRLMAHELTHVVQQTKGSDILPLAREALIQRGYFSDKAESLVRHIPGYSLVTVLIGRTLISGKKIAMSAENLLGGLLGLIPSGTVMFDRLKESGVLKDAFDWVEGKLGEVNLTWTRIKNDLSNALDTLNPFKAARNVKRMLGNLLQDVVRFVKAIAKKLLELIVKAALKLAGNRADQVWGILQKAGQSISFILDDPLEFAKNLVKAVVGGFQQFSSRILEHLKKGLLGWLFGSLDKAGIKLPAKLDFKGLISLTLQLIGVTYENFRKKLVKKLGAKGEKMVSMMEKSVEVARILMKEGFAGIWQKLLGMIDNFKLTLIDGLSNMVKTSLVEAGIGWLASLSNPVGAIIRVVLAIYKLIVTFIERFDQIKAVAESIFNSVGAIAKGQVKTAANFIEETIGRSVPVVISFVAALIPISGITKKIKNVIDRLRKPVDKAMNKLLDFMMKKAKKLFSKLIAKVNAKRQYPSANFKIGEKQHHIFSKKKGGKLATYIASENPRLVQDVEFVHKTELKKIKNQEGPAVAAAMDIAKQIKQQTEEADDEISTEANKVKPDNEKINQLKLIKKLEKEILEAAQQLSIAGKATDNNAAISSQTTVALFRAAEPRLMQFEGESDTHTALMSKSKGRFSSLIPEPISSYYEMDHTIEKRFAKVVLENLQLIDPEKAEERQGKDIQETKHRADRAGSFNAQLNKDQAKGLRPGEKHAGKSASLISAEAAPLGLIGTGLYSKIPETAPVFPAVAMYRHNHVKGKGLNSHTSAIEQARSKKDPHAHVKSTLKAQLKLEVKQMEAKMDKDVSATPELRSRVSKGIAKAKGENKRIFGLEKTRARRLSAKEKKDKNNKTFENSSSALGFEGGNGAPNFLKLEGKGGEYGPLGSMTEHLERDHIVDKAYPKMAAELPLMNRQEKTSLDKAVEDLREVSNKKLSKEQSKRLKAAKSSRLFPKDSRISKYTDKNGYAIPLYKPLARRVTSKTGVAIKPAGLAAEVTYGDVKDIADYVMNGVGNKLSGWRSGRSKQVAAVVNARALSHSVHVANVYREQLRLVPSLQEEGAKKLAKANMLRISGQVYQSLAAARSKTNDLFK